MDELMELHRNEKSEGEWWTRLRRAREAAMPELREWFRAGRLPLQPEALQKCGVTPQDLAELLERGAVSRSDLLGSETVTVTVEGLVPVDRTVLRRLQATIFVSLSKSPHVHAEWP